MTQPSQSFAQKGEWTHEKIVNKLLMEEENDFISGERRAFGLNDGTELKVIDKKLYLNGYYIMDVSSYYEADIENKDDPVIVNAYEFPISKTRSFYSVNVLLNRYTGGRAAGRNLYFLETDKSTEQDAEGLIPIALSEDFIVSDVFKDKEDHVWISGYQKWWKNIIQENVFTLDADFSLLNWADVLREENKTSEDVKVFANLVKGQDGMYIWYWENTERSMPWLDREYLSEGVVFKTGLESGSPVVKKIASTSSKEKHYGMEGAYDYSPISKTILITENDQVYYKTELPGYIHLNNNSYIPIESVDTLNGKEVGEVIGRYDRTDLVLERNEDIIDIYMVDDQYAVLVEDLRLFGIGMFYDPDARLTRFSGNNDDGYYNESDRYVYNTKAIDLPKSGDILASDVKLYIGNDRVHGYNVGGYSLVKLDEYLNANFYTENDFVIRHKITGERVGLSGNVSGTIINSGSEQLSGEVLLYGSNETTAFNAYVMGDDNEGIRIGTIDPLLRQSFTMESEEETIGFSFDKNDIDRLPLYNSYFIGYRLDSVFNGSENYLLSSDENKGSLIYLSQFDLKHNDLELELLSKRLVTAEIKLPDPIYYVESTLDRKLIVKILKLNNGLLQDEKQVVKVVDQNDQEISIQFELDANGLYEIRYQLNLFDGGVEGFRIYDEGYLYATDDSQMRNQWVDFSKYNSTMSMAIQMQDVVVGIKPTYIVAYGYETDIKVKFNEVEIEAVNMEGVMMASLETISALGLESEVDMDLKTVIAFGSTNSKYQKTNNKNVLDASEVGEYSHVAAYLTGWTLNVDAVEIPLFMIDNKLSFNVECLKSAGYKVIFDEDSRILSVFSPE